MPMSTDTLTLPADQIVAGDCLKTMADCPADSIDLIFADPPYNIGFKYADHYDDNRDPDDYVRWTEDWISACSRLLRPSGSLYILIGDEYAAETRLHLKRLEADGQLVFRNWVIWHYTFGQNCKLKFNRSHAHLFYCVGAAATSQFKVSEPPFTFNRDAVAVPSARMTTYKDSRQNPKGKMPDDTWVLKFPAMQDWFTRPQEAVAADPNLFTVEQDTWYQSRLCGTFKEREGWHPCQLPEALLERIVKLSSNPGDLVFDPFAGSGTTLAVARRLGRHWLGCELSEDYADKAEARVMKVQVERTDEV